MPSQLTSHPFQSRPTATAANDAYGMLLKHLHPKQKAPGLTFEQQVEVFNLAGGYGWENVVSADDQTIARMADAVDTLLTGASLH